MIMKHFIRKKNQSGFTLVEIAIVMVIIGLLIGGVLKGQAMIQNAKVKRVVKQADELRAAINTFYDKYGVYPGDVNKAAIPPGTDNEGDGDGIIEAAEDEPLFMDLQLSGLISGSYNGTSDLPFHAFGDNITLYDINDPNPSFGNRLNFILYNIPPDVGLEIDSKYDDGIYNTGSITSSAVYTSANEITLYILF
jgi:prepilin-type N-terminal cleavage/methylation domain-containing protein